MPDIAVMPQPVQVKTPKVSSSPQPARVAMQKAASPQADTPAPSAPASPAPVKSQADKAKSSDQPVQFFSVLMAQLAAPVGQVQVNPQTPAQAPVTDTSDALVAQQAAAPLAAPVVDLTAVQSTEPTVQQVVTSPGQAPIAATAETVEAVAVPLAQTSDDQTPAVVPVTRKAAAPAVSETTPEPATPKADTVQKQPDQPNTNPIPAAAQTPSAPSLKNDEKPAVSDAVQVAGTDAEEVVVGAYSDKPKIPTPTVPNKPALAEALANRATGRWESRQAGTPAKQTKTGEAIQTQPVVNTNAQAVFHNPNMTPANAVQTATSTAATTQVPAAQVTATTVDADADLRPASTQLVESIRAAAPAAGTEKTLNLNLNPPELGRVTIRLQDTGGSITAVMKVDNPMTRADIEQSVPSIVRSLEQAGIQVRRIDVLPSDPIPQEGSNNRQYDFQGGMPNQQRDSQQAGQSGRTDHAGAGSADRWQSSQTPGLAASQQSVVTDSAINIYM
jgi:flagellar hook-length control protein FliK